MYGIPRLSARGFSVFLLVYICAVCGFSIAVYFLLAAGLMPESGYGLFLPIPDFSALPAVYFQFFVPVLPSTVFFILNTALLFVLSAGIAVYLYLFGDPSADWWDAAVGYLIVTLAMPVVIAVALSLGNPVLSQNLGVMISPLFFGLTGVWVCRFFNRRYLTAVAPYVVSWVVLIVIGTGLAFVGRYLMPVEGYATVLTAVAALYLGFLSTYVMHGFFGWLQEKEKEQSDSPD